MILIADSGSSKTDWVLIRNSNDDLFFESEGLNPFYKSQKEIIDEINQKLISKISIKEIKNVFFYGAGCMDYEKGNEVQQALSVSFPESNIHVESDILGAARASSSEKKEISSILGTGANICLYENDKIITSRSGIGFILGDEGSGAHLGKHLISSYLNDFLPKDIHNQFESEFKYSKSTIIDQVYRQAQPSKFLASFSKFILKNKENPFISNIIDNCFEEFFRNHVTQFEDHKTIQLNIVGSIGHYFKDEITRIAKKYEVKIGNIIQKPIKGLLKYHKKGL